MTTVSAAITIESLPDEILVMIFDYLSDIHDRVHLCSANRNFLRFLPEFVLDYASDKVQNLLPRSRMGPIDAFFNSVPEKDTAPINDFWNISACNSCTPPAPCAYPLCAQYFEWKDGNPGGEDRQGRFVKLTRGTKPGMIEYAYRDDDVLGVSLGSSATSTTRATSTTSCVTCQNNSHIGNSAETGWYNMYLRDEFGNLETRFSLAGPIRKILDKYQVKITPEMKTILNFDDKNNIKTAITNRTLTSRGTASVVEHGHEEISTESGVLGKSVESANSINSTFDQNLVKLEIIRARGVWTKAINPMYDPSLHYIPRSQRPEWSSVVICGKVYVRDNGYCQVGKKCDCSCLGIAKPGSRYPVLSRTGPRVIQIFIK